MPIYEYRCDCGCTTTKIRKVEERDNPCDCENCGKNTKRVVSTGSFRVKGANFLNGYTTKNEAMKNNKDFNKR